MGILRIVEYGRYCDDEFCGRNYHNVAAWTTRAACETDSIAEGWVRRGKRWYCPDCVRDAKARAAKQ